jgi:hypothetical protein
VTGGDDKTIRMFDTNSYKQINILTPENNPSKVIFDKVRGIDW